MARFNQHWQKIAFIAAIAERHYLNFALFADMADTPEQGAFYRKSLNKVWEYLAGQLKSLKNIESTLAEFETMVPDPEGIDHYGVYPAMDAAVILVSALQMILDKTIDDTRSIGELSTNTVADFICLIEELENFDPESQSHELYDNELEFQQQVIEKLHIEEKQEQIIRSLRQFTGQINVSNLGISLE